MRRVNLPFFLGVLASLLAIVLGVAGLHHWQTGRNADVFVKNADKLLAEGKPLEAAAQFAKYLELRPRDHQRRVQFARILNDLARKPGEKSDFVRWAIVETEKALRGVPNEKELRLNHAELLMLAGEPKAAQGHLNELRQRPGLDDLPLDDPTEDLKGVKISTMYAKACINLREDDEALVVLGRMVGYVPEIDAFDTAIKIPPGRAEAFVLLAGLLERHFEEPDAADVVIRKMTEVAPEDPIAWRYLSWWRDTHGDLDAAAEAIEKSVELSPRDHESLYQEFCVAIRQRRLERAETIINGILGDISDSPAYAIARADLALAKGDTDAMIRFLREGVERFPDETRVLTKFVFSLADLKRFDELEEVVTHAREVMGASCVPALYADAVVAMDGHRWIKALGLWLRLRPLMAGDVAYTRMIDLRLAACHDALGESDRTLGAGFRLLNEDPNLIEALLTLALTYERAGWSERSLELCETIAREMPIEQLAGRPAVFVPLIRMRLWEQTRSPVPERDWAKVETLINDLKNAKPAEPIDPALLEGLEIDVIEAKGLREEAISRSSIAVTTHPRSPILLGQRAVLLGGDSALQLIDGAPDELRNSAEMLRAAILIALECPHDEGSRRLEDAEQRSVALSVTGGGRVRQELVAGYLQIGDVSGARRVAKSMATVNPEDLSSFMMLIDLAFIEEDFAAAQAHAESLVAMAHPDDANGRYAKAVKLVASVLERRRDRLASDALETVLTPDEQFDLEEARHLLVEVTIDRPRWGMVPRLLSEIAEIRGDRSLAIGELQRAIDLGGRQWATLRRLAIMLHAAGRYDEAREVIRDLEGHGGTGVERIVADMEARGGRVSAALARGERITPENCRDPLQWMWFGRLLAGCGRSNQAEAALRRAVDVAPDRLDARLALIRYLVSQGRRGEAREAIRRAEQAIPAERRDLFTVRALETLEDVSGAESLHREKVASAPEDLDAARGLAEFLIRSGQETQARVELRRIMALDGAQGTPTLGWAKRMLAIRLAKESYPEFLEALGLLATNVDGEGRQSEDDLAITIDLLQSRSEPAHWMQAIDFLAALAERRSLTVDQRFTQARLEARLDHWEEARKVLLDIALTEDATPALRAFFVDGLIDHGDLLAARQWMDRARVGDKDSPVLRRLELKLAVAQGNQASIEQVMKRLLPDERVRKENIDRLLAGAKIAEEFGFVAPAERFYEEYASLAPLGGLERVAFLGRQRKTAEAVEVLMGILGDFPAPRILGTLQGIIKQVPGPLDQAVAARVNSIIDRARRENPGNLEIEFRAASISERIGSPAEAEAIYRQLLASGKLDEEQMARVSANLAWLLTSDETAQEAFELLDRAIRSLGPDPELLDTRSLVRLSLGQPIRALEDIREAVLEPTALRYLHLAIVEAANGQIPEARAALDRARAKGLADQWLSPADQRRLEEIEKVVAEPAEALSLRGSPVLFPE